MVHTQHTQTQTQTHMYRHTLLTLREGTVTAPGPVVWADSLLLIVSKNHRVISAHICTDLEEVMVVVVMTQMSNLQLSYGKMDAVREIPSQTFPVVQSVVVSVKGED